MSDKSNLLTTFIDQFQELLDDLERIMPSSYELKYGKKSFMLLKSINPKLIITVWKYQVYDLYKEQIDNSDFNFFIVKDYSSDIYNVKNQDKIIEMVNTMRSTVSTMSDDNKTKTMKYIFNLSTLSNYYFE